MFTLIIAFFEGLEQIYNDFKVSKFIELEHIE